MHSTFPWYVDSPPNVALTGDGGKDDTSQEVNGKCGWMHELHGMDVKSKYRTSQLELVCDAVDRGMKQLDCLYKV